VGAIKDLLDLFKDLSGSISDRKTREKLGPIQDKIMEVQTVQLDLQERVADIKEKHAKEKSALETRIAELEKQQLAGDFVTHNGLLWKTTQSGGFETAPYCTKCKLAMLDLEVNWGCTVCRYRAERSEPPPKPKGEAPMAMNRQIRS
jgi:hypothetical protein